MSKTKDRTAEPLPQHPLDTNTGTGKSPYRWPDLSVDGEGLSPEISEAEWAALRDRIYAESE